MNAQQAAMATNSKTSLYGKGFPRHKRLRAGATLLEITFVLLIIVGIIAGVLYTASSAMNQASASEEAQTMVNLSSSVRKIRTNQGYGSTLVSDLRALGMIPANIVDTGSGETLQNSFGGDITITAISDGAHFQITYTNIPKRECVTLVNMLQAGILQSVGNGTSSTDNISALTPTLVDTKICSSNTVNTLTWSSEILGS